MNYDCLLHERPLPAFFKVLSTISIGIIVMLGLYIKFTDNADAVGISPHFLKWFLYLSLCAHLVSKDKIEDERNKEIQLQIFRVGFKLFLGMLMIVFGAPLGTDDSKGYSILYFVVIAVLGFLVIFSEAAKRTRLTDLIEKNRPLYLLSILVILLAILYFNQWLWDWPTA